MLLLLCVTVGFLHQHAAVSGCSVGISSGSKLLCSIHNVEHTWRPKEGGLTNQGIQIMQSGCVYSHCRLTQSTILLHKNTIQTLPKYNTVPDCLTAIVIKMFFLVLLATTEHPSGLTGRYVCFKLNM